MQEQGVNSDGEPIRDFYVVHEPVNLVCDDDGMTRQEFADECNINVLMATYERNGSISHFNRAQPAYFDASEVPDLARSLELMSSAEAAFMSLPAGVRREFDNNAVNFVEYAQDPANLSRMREWGLAPPAPVPDEPITPDPAPPSA